MEIKVTYIYTLCGNPVITYQQHQQTFSGNIHEILRITTNNKNMHTEPAQYRQLQYNIK